MIRALLAFVALALSGPCLADAQTFDLMKITRLGGKGRVQDAAYQPKDPQIAAILAAGKDAIPHLIDKLESTTRYETSPMSFWPAMTESDVALILLSDLFLDPTWTRSTLPELCWDKLLARSTPDTPSWELVDSFVKSHGRRELARRWRAAWTQYGEGIRWEPEDKYFIVEGRKLVSCAPEAPRKHSHTL